MRNGKDKHCLGHLISAVCRDPGLPTRKHKDVMFNIVLDQPIRLKIRHLSQDFLKDNWIHSLVSFVTLHYLNPSIHVSMQSTVQSKLSPMSNFGSCPFHQSFPRGKNLVIQHTYRSCRAMGNPNPFSSPK